MTGNWAGRRVVVTGGEGFIGSHLVEQLLSAGADVSLFAHYKPYGEAGFLREHLDHVRLVPGDIRDPGQVFDAVKGADTVFHLAALIGIPYSYSAPATYVQVNVEGTRNLVDACHRRGVRRIVHTSTSEVYGSALKAPIDESHPLQPQSPYAASKIGADAIALSYFHSFDTPVSICRPFNTYGPRQSPRAFIPAMLDQLLSGARTVRVGSLEPTRDFTYVADTVSGFISIADSDSTIGEVVNLGTGTEISIGDVLRTLIELTGSNAQIDEDFTRLRPAQSEVMRLVSDNTKAHELTGWKPTVQLPEGLRRTIEWMSLQPRTASPSYQR